MAKNSNYKYDAFAEQAEAARKLEAERKAKKIRKIALIVSIAVLLSLFAFAIIQSIPSDGSTFYKDRDLTGRDISYVEMKLEGYDTPVVILLDGTSAPVTVKNFIKLVNEKFYDGLNFHRLIKNFMAQGGAAPEGKEPESIKGEFSSNGIENDLLHKRGTISMARSHKNSATSGFFICDADSEHLDGEYAAFGYVISGLRVIDSILSYSEGKTDDNGNILPEYHKPVIEYIRVIDINDK